MAATTATSDGTNSILSPLDQTQIQKDKYLNSRQLEVYGREAMRHLVGANVLISGLQGLDAWPMQIFSSFLFFFSNFMSMNW